MTSRTKQLTGSDFRFCVTTSFIRALITFLDPDGDYILVPQAAVKRKLQRKISNKEKSDFRYYF